METILDTETARLVFYPEKKIVHHTIKKYMYGESLFELMMQGADVFVANGCHKWLSDDRGNGALREEDVAWLQENWEGRIVGEWRYWALVVPESVIGQMNMRKIVERYAEKGVTVKTFTDPVFALAWLEAQ